MYSEYQSYASTGTAAGADAEERVQFSGSVYLWGFSIYTNFTYGVF